MPDGVRLAARIWMPESAEDAPVPAILEYIPYRKRDGTVTRDTMTHSYYAGHGYAGVRVDIRGSGDSEGVLHDEYSQQELDDGLEILRWLERQPWCNGRCGIMGISWGGFNGLQLASLQPPQLDAVVTICSTDDRYADDVHYMGGCLLGDNLSWAATMLGYMTLPPDPQIVGDRWESMWMQRLEAAESWLVPWLRHQTRDKYWEHGSVCEDYSKIRTPVMAVSGWADPYTNSVFRLVRDLPPDVPRMGLVGPWAHKYPHIGVPGPAIGFLQETLRWWDRHLKDDETNGIDDESTLRLYMQDSMPPSTGYEHRPGRWIAEPRWPSPNIEDVDYPLTTGYPTMAMRADGRPANSVESEPRNRIEFSSPVTLGYFGGKWCGESAPPDLPDDQREEDGGAVLFQSPRLEQQIEIVGAPVVHLELDSDQPVAMIAARLCEVLPDGRVTRLTYGLLNLTHRNSHATAEPLERGRRYSVAVRMNDLAQTIPPGHRVRLALSTSYWPQVWLPPARATLGIETSRSHLSLPIRSPEAPSPSVTFPPVEAAAPTKSETIEATERSWKVIRDIGAGRSELQVRKGRGRQYWRDIDLERSSRGVERYTVDHDAINTASGEVHWEHFLARGPWKPHIKTKTRLTCDEQNFYLHVDIDAFLNNQRVFCRTREYQMPRHGI
ncbi:peptidase S15 [Rhodopirellula sp. SM50]|nr:peptidase S15 [Rhodopirellula sp. SM50]